MIHGRSRLSLQNKITIHRTILKPIWACGIQLWNAAANSKIEIVERFQAKILKKSADAPWYVPNSLVQKNLSEIRSLFRRSDSSTSWNDWREEDLLILQSTTYHHSKQKPSLILKVHNNGCASMDVLSDKSSTHYLFCYIHFIFPLKK